MIDGSKGFEFPKQKTEFKLYGLHISQNFLAYEMDLCLFKNEIIKNHIDMVRVFIAEGKSFELMITNEIAKNNDVVWALDLR